MQARCCVLKPGERRHLQPQGESTYIVLRVARFVYAIDKLYLPVLLPLFLRPTRDGVMVPEEGSLLATFGLFKLATPLANVTGAHITRNYRWWTACGVRMSRVDDGLTFGTNRDAGVCIHFGGTDEGARRGDRRVNRARRLTYRSTSSDARNKEVLWPRRLVFFARLLSMGCNGGGSGERSNEPITGKPGGSGWCPHA